MTPKFGRGRTIEQKTGPTISLDALQMRALLAKSEKPAHPSHSSSYHNCIKIWYFFHTNLPIGYSSN